MRYKGQVRDGVIVLEGDAVLAEGTAVEVLAGDRADNPAEEPPESPREFAASAEPVPSLYARYKSIIGAVRDLPADFAEQHDYYIHGKPRE